MLQRKKFNHPPFSFVNCKKLNLLYSRLPLNKGDRYPDQRALYETLVQLPPFQGLLDRYLWLKAKGERDHARNHPDSGTPMPLGMRHALSMMLALWVGLGAGLLAFICELAFRARGGETRMQNRRRSNRRVRMIQLVM